MTAPLVAKIPYDVDLVANEIARTAAIAKAMPPAWDGAKVAHCYTGTQGENLGRVLPGRGVVLSSDLKSLGITKPIPHVFEKTLTMKAIEAFGGRERLAIGAASMLLGAKLGVLGMGEAIMSFPMLAGAITNYDGIINGRANGKGEEAISFVSTQTSVALQWHSLIRTSTKHPAGTFAPANIPGGTAVNETTAGVLFPNLTSPSGADKKYLLTIGYSSGTTLNQLMLHDLLVAAANINANVNTAQTVNTTALTRYSGAASAGNLMTFEVTTALGATASSLTITYTNSSGTGSRSTGPWTMTTSAIAGRLQPVSITPTPFIPMAAGDIGLRSVETVQFSAAMGAGVMNLYIYRPLHWLPGIATNIYIERDSTVQIDGLTEILVGSDSQLGALNYFVLPNGTTVGNVTMFLRTVMG